MNSSQHRRSRTLGLTRPQIAAVLGGSAILLGGGGAALANAQDAGSSAPNTSSSQVAPSAGSTAPGTTGSADGTGTRGDQRGGKGSAEMAQALATKLGLDQATVQTALDQVRQDERTANQGQARPTTPPTDAERAQKEAAMAQALATKLGVDQQKVTDALTALRTEHQATEKQELSTRLDQAVTDGKISATDKDSILKAFDAGVLGGGRGGH